jgi:hypothetical protein
MMGGLSTPYATTPMNKKSGITIGGTRYFMVFPLLRELGWRHQQVTPERRRYRITKCWTGVRRRGQRWRAI